ncbi:MAG: hypothetical protein ACFB13_00110 [Kiloniellaceae bacterium]
MARRLHAAAGVAGFLLIAVFWSATALSELFGSTQSIAAVKAAILWGMLALVPALAGAGASGMAMGRKRRDASARAKMRRMPVIAFNGLLVLMPSAFFLAARAEAGIFDVWFYGVQAIELVAGALNITLIGLNIRDGLAMTGRWELSRRRSAPARRAG